MMIKIKIKIKMNWVIYTVSSPQTVTQRIFNNNSSLHHLYSNNHHLYKDSHHLYRDSYNLHINTRNNKAYKSLR